MDWANIIRKEAERSAILRSDQLAHKYHIVKPSVTQALARQESRGLVNHISKTLYFNLLAHSSQRELVNELRHKSYISLESALYEYGLSTQSPRAITCVTTERPREFKGNSFHLIYRGIAESLYWGFVKKATRYGSYNIAEPEKALLDWIYLSLQNGIEPALDEIEFGQVDRLKLVEYAKRYPSTVNKHLLPELASNMIGVLSLGRAGDIRR
jgi:predicted transcriptional regulator of viral defense system